MYARVRDEQPAAIQKVRAIRAHGRGGDAALLAAPELMLVPRLLRGIPRRWVVLIVAGSVAFVTAIAVVIFVWNSANENMARQASTRFGAALIHNTPNAAPPGAADYVSGVRAHFGPVRSAKVIGSHQKAVGHEPYVRSFFVTDLLLSTRRGPAVVEVEFDNHAINSDRVSRVYELAPRFAPGLSAAQHRQLDATLKARGGKLADPATLAVTSSPAVIQRAAKTSSTSKPINPVPVLTTASTPARSTTAKRLHCVRASHGNIRKLVRCAH